MNKRLWLLNGKTKSAVDYLEAYHCDHTRQVTPMHQSGSNANDINKFVHNVEEIKANNDATWGLAEYKLEEFALKKNPSQFLISKLSKSLSKYRQSETYSAYTSESYEKNVFPEAHVMLFVCDHLIPMGNKLTIGWLGVDKGRKKTLSTMLASLGISIKLIDITNNPNTQKIDSIIVSNFSSNNRNFQRNRELYLKLFKFTMGQYENCRETKFIFTDVIQTRFELLVRANFNCSKTPYSARILSGKLKRKTIFEAWMQVKFIQYFYINKSFSFFYQNRNATFVASKEFRKSRPITFQFFRLLYKFLSFIGILKLIGWH